MVDVQTRQPRGVEALIRWRHPTGAGPARPIHPARRGNRADRAARRMGPAARPAPTRAAGPAQSSSRSTCRRSSSSKGDLFDLIRRALVESGLPPERLEIEITESVLLESDAKIAPASQKLKNIGISLALDDFGTGYSSLGYLTTFPFDKIKIDKSFIADLEQAATRVRRSSPR